MKTSKRILSAVLALCMILGCFATGFSALAAATDLQTGINAAIANGKTTYEWTGGDVTLENTLVINGNIAIDFNNAVITGAPGKSVVNVKGGEVTLYNGTFIAECEAYQGAIDFASTLVDYRPAVSINGGDVTLECITAVGSTIRIPNSHTIKVTNGNGINANNGNVVLKDVIALGMKALDNTKATVTIEDAILVGVYKAINILNKVTFADGYNKYETVDVIEEFLKDGVSLSASEKKYIAGLTNSQGDLSVGSVIATAKAPSFEAPTSEYDAETDVLKVIAKADTTNEKADVANRYSYRYTPDTCTIDGVTADFVKQADGTYAATFNGVAANAELDAELDYNLSVKMGARQKAYVTTALEKVAEYAEKAPELIGRFIKDFEGESAYGKFNEYLDLIYGAYFTVDGLKNMDAVKKFMGVVYALKGMDYTGNTGNKGLVSQLNPNWNDTIKAKAIAASLKNQENEFGKIFDTDGDGVADSLYAFKGDIIGEGIGILELFDEYYNTFKGLALTEDYSDFNDVGAAAEYIGANYADILALVDAALELVEYGYALLDDPQLQKVLADNFGDAKVIIDYADKLMADGGYYWSIKSKYEELKASSFIDTYGDRAGELCKRYALKALDILQNPTKYFDINSKVEGYYLNVFSFTDNAVIKTPADENVEYCNVTVKVAGYGKFSVDGEVESVLKTYKVEQGEFFSVLPVEYDDAEVLFRDYVLTQPNGSWQVVSSLANFRVGSDITITLNFSAKDSQDDDDVNIVFLTDGNLGYNWIGDYDGAAEKVVPSDVVVPEYKGMEFAGWSLDKNASADVALTGDELVDAIAGRTDDFFVYAVYDAQADVVISKKEITATVDTATSRVYFSTYVDLPDNQKAIEVGIIATKNADYATEDKMTLDLNGTSGVAVKKSDAYGDDGYLVDNLYYELGVKTASGTVYGRGYVIIKNLDTGAVETVYTSIASGTL